MKRKDPSDAEKVIPLSKRIVAEFIGTFTLVFAAAGASVADTLSGHELGALAVVAAPGLAIAAMIYAVDKISGAYFNPAISIGFALTGHLRKRDLPFYIAVQVAAAIVASLVVAFAIAPYGHSDATGLTVPHTGWLASFVIEIVFTFILMFVAISLKEDVGYKAFGGIAIGAAITALGIMGMPVSGASMNPARSFGPALVAGNFSDQWVYWVAPIIGAVVAVLAFEMAKDNKKKAG
ncbi:permease, glycerol uptake facilitator [Candidatus Nitrososphaera evergladensis SR1]|uniref:Permease, glycerol uptake facilitator n=1 Tax=Candidatus Nitrososphaera evergladensis SR1 TaxID=1459636 RepID=A0A075MPL1_9ARCH|nr:aquaporin [Candidatus Nitrososphaera evergladensis]AIF82752.1 permease, glycerol uptake facilitator [Candidatus Nitrososphaera evergladensis SR1]